MGGWGAAQVVAPLQAKSLHAEMEEACDQVLESPEFGRMLRVSLPMLLVVLKAWVTEMKETPCASNNSTSYRERAYAEALSVALGGLPLAHEQAAAYCERLEISCADYTRRLAAAPAKMLDAEKDAPAEYHDRLTVAKTFALAIDEAARLHPAAEPLIVHAIFRPADAHLAFRRSTKETNLSPQASSTCLECRSTPGSWTARTHFFSLNSSAPMMVEL